MPVLAPILEWLPALVFIWMVVGAGLLFTRDVGQRDARGLGIALSIWGTLGAKIVAITPPPSVQLIGAGGLLLSLALYQWAAISISGRLFSYAGNNDLPQFVHRSGPYAYVRNPFYLSYLLAEIATVVMWPSVWGGVIVVLATVYFQWLARFEEGKFARQYGRRRVRAIQGQDRAPPAASETARVKPPDALSGTPQTTVRPL